jgi:hypothetical protein
VGLCGLAGCYCYLGKVARLGRIYIYFGYFGISVWLGVKTEAEDRSMQN